MILELSCLFDEWPIHVANYYKSIPKFPLLTIWDVDDYMSKSDIPVRWRENHSSITRTLRGYTMEFRSPDEYIKFVLRWSE